jgi:hypothetical protein
MNRSELIASGAVKETNTFMAIEYFYRNQADAELDREGNRPDLVIAAFCAETGRPKFVEKPKRDPMLEYSWDVE